MTEAAHPVHHDRWWPVGLLLILVSTLTVASCRESEQDRLSRELDQLLRQARALVRTGGCATTQECAVAAVGAKPCGGPRTYWVYCRASTDEAALLARLEEARRVEALLNQLTGAASDCRFVEPPTFRAVGGVCQVSQP